MTEPPKLQSYVEALKKAAEKSKQKALQREQDKNKQPVLQLKMQQRYL
jgi:hypothetical protein